MAGKGYSSGLVRISRESRTGCLVGRDVKDKISVSNSRTILTGSPNFWITASVIIIALQTLLHVRKIVYAISFVPRPGDEASMQSIAAIYFAGMYDGKVLLHVFDILY